MVNQNDVVEERDPEKVLRDVQAKSSEEQELDDIAAGKEWASRYGLGVCWDVVSYAFFFIAVLQEVLRKYPWESFTHSLQMPDSIAILFAQGFVLLVLSSIQILFVRRFGAPGSALSQYLKLYVIKSINTF